MQSVQSRMADPWDEASGKLRDILAIAVHRYSDENDERFLGVALAAYLLLPKKQRQPALGFARKLIARRSVVLMQQAGQDRSLIRKCKLYKSLGMAAALSLAEARTGYFARRSAIKDLTRAAPLLAQAIAQSDPSLLISFARRTPEYHQPHYEDERAASGEGADRRALQGRRRHRASDTELVLPATEPIGLDPRSRMSSSYARLSPREDRRWFG